MERESEREEMMTKGGMVARERVESRNVGLREQGKRGNKGINNWRQVERQGRKTGGPVEER